MGLDQRRTERRRPPIIAEVCIPQNDLVFTGSQGSVPESTEIEDRRIACNHHVLE